MIARGDIYWANEKGVLTAKPRPVLIVQNEKANRVHSTITCCLITSTIGPASPFRIEVGAGPSTGLDRPSEVQADRIFSLQRDSLERRLGSIGRTDLRRVDAALRRWLDL